MWKEPPPVLGCTHGGRRTAGEDHGMPTATTTKRASKTELLPPATRCRRRFPRDGNRCGRRRLLRRHNLIYYLAVISSSSLPLVRAVFLGPIPPSSLSSEGRCHHHPRGPDRPASSFGCSPPPPIQGGRRRTATATRRTNVQQPGYRQRQWAEAHSNRYAPPDDDGPRDDDDNNNGVVREVQDDNNDSDSTKDSTVPRITTAIKEKNELEEAQLLGMRLTLPELLRELGERGARFDPGATRTDLERMLLHLRLWEEDGGGRQPRQEVEGVMLTEVDSKMEERTSDCPSVRSTTPEPEPTSPGRSATRVSRSSSHDMPKLVPNGREEEVPSLPAPLFSSTPTMAASGRFDEKDESVSGGAEVENTVSTAETAPTNAVAVTPTEVPVPAAAFDVREIALADVLGELQQHGVRFSPRSTRADLERLLLEARANRKVGAAASSFGSDGSVAFEETMFATTAWTQDESVRPEAKTRPGETRAATRKQRQPDYFRKHQRQRAQRRRQLPRDEDEMQDSARAPWDAVVNWSSAYIPGAVDQAYETAQRTLRKVGRKASDYLKVDDDGVRDADFTYLYRDEDLYGRVHWLNDEVFDSSSTSNMNGRRKPNEPVQGRKRQAQGSSRRPSSRQSSASRSSHEIQRPSEDLAEERRARYDSFGRRRHNGEVQERRAPSNERHYDKRRGTPRPVPRQAVFTKRPFLLPPARGSLPTADNATDSSPETSTPSSSTASTPSQRPVSESRVYSPYGGRDRFDDVGDGLDRFGKFVADVADRFMWGPDDEDRKGNVDAATESRPRTKEDEMEPPDASSSRTKYRHWKDRLEAQFDTVLGISEDGAYYRRWADKARRDRHNEGETNDPFSVARGVQPKRRGLSSPHQRNRRYEKPIWEEEGNLVALLFGRTQSGNSLLFEKLLDPNHGSLLFLLRAVFRSLLLVGSYACRWASVRGAFPQPVVVIGVFSALVCAPRNRRMLAVGAALVFFRALGELAHGYAYGDDGWEDDADSSRSSRRSSRRDEDEDDDDDSRDE